MHTTSIHPKHRSALPAYYLGRPADTYRRRYRRVAITLALGS